MKLAFHVELKEGWGEAWREALRFGAGLGWRGTPRGLETGRGTLPYPGTGERVFELDPSAEAGALAALVLLRLLDPKRVRIRPRGSMFSLWEASRFLQRQGFPVDPWFATGRELVVARAPRMGGELLYAVEVEAGEGLEEALGGVWALPTGEVLPTLPRGARPVGEDFPRNRVWLLEAAKRAR